jgi:hypothetical protein
MLDDFFPKHLADRVAGFAGRQWVLDNVAEWVGDPSAPRVLLITGEPGCGKTALSAWLGAPSDELPAGPLKDVRSAWTARHFCMAEERGGSVQPARFAQLLGHQIGERIPNFGPLVLEFVAPTVKGKARADVNWGEVIGTQIINLIINSPDPNEVYDRSIRQPLERLCERQPDTRIFILVDALDEALSAKCDVHNCRPSRQFGGFPVQRSLSSDEPPGAESAREVSARPPAETFCTRWPASDSATRWMRNLILRWCHRKARPARHGHIVGAGD